MKFTENPLQGSFLINLEPRVDERGFFSRYYCEKEFMAYGLNTNWVQANDSLSEEVATLRGLHYQIPPRAEVKLVRCIRGAIWDVIVDLRKGSKTFGEWFGEELTEDNRMMMYVPQGFAHGFITLSADTEIIYLVSDFYTPEAERTLLWCDEKIGIKWPIDPLHISQKDRNGAALSMVKDTELFKKD